MVYIYGPDARVTTGTVTNSPGLSRMWVFAIEASLQAKISQNVLNLILPQRETNWESVSHPEE